MAGIISPSGGSSTQRYGKGTGYAGGSASSGIDGLRIAAAAVEKLKQTEPE
jgi:hypothetical protein